MSLTLLRPRPSPSVRLLSKKTGRRPPFVAPLDAQRRRGHYEDTADATAQEEFGENEPGLDGLAESDVVGDQQRDARHAECL